MASQNNTPKVRPKVRIPLLIPACVLLTLCALFTVYCAVWRGDPWRYYLVMAVVLSALSLLGLSLGINRSFRWNLFISLALTILSGIILTVCLCWPYHVRGWWLGLCGIAAGLVRLMIDLIRRKKGTLL